MRGEGASSVGGAGCAAFSLLGVLVTVGIIAWLATKGLPGGDSGAALRRATSTVTVPNAHALDVSLAPATGLREDTPVVVTVAGLDPGATFSVFTCLRGGSLVIGAASPCDKASARRTKADASGKATVPYRPARVITAGNMPFDCADEPKTCEVRVTQVSVSSNGKAGSGSAPLSFRSDLPRAEITIDTGG